LTDLPGHEAVLRARVALGECMMVAGWTPTAEVAQHPAAVRNLLARTVVPGPGLQVVSGTPSTAMSVPRQ
jgi:hypothetical protein